jgi:hypothetical protein
MPAFPSYVVLVLSVPPDGELPPELAKHDSKLIQQVFDTCLALASPMLF